MSGPPRPSFPSAPSEPAIRRLGVRSSTHIDRPFRPQMIVGLVAGVVLLAVPLYFMRGPSEPPKKEIDDEPLGFAPSVPAGIEKIEKNNRLSLGEFQRVSCSSAQGVRGQAGRECDRLPFFEKSLARAIEESLDCAPRTGEGGTLNYVLSVDFNKKTLHVFPGASGMWKGPQARRATKCVKQALPAPEWDKLSHSYRYYEIAVLTTYKAPPATATPLFE